MVTITAQTEATKWVNHHYKLFFKPVGGKTVAIGTGKILDYCGDYGHKIIAKALAQTTNKEVYKLREKYAVYVYLT